MRTLSRRSLLRGAAGLTTLGAGVTLLPASASARVRVVREQHRVVVIGSGFGGGVTALRLANAGVPVLVLERGQRWPAGPNSETFPRPTSPDKRMFWLGSAPSLPGIPSIPFAPYTGLLEQVPGEGMLTICAAGVGGGSLVYQGMTLQPSAELFQKCFPETLDYAELDRVYYPRVAAMLKLQTAPDELVNSKTYAAARIFARNARRAGYAIEKIPMPIDWNFALRELKGEMKPAYTNGDGALGVNNGGKHSIDVTYLAAAEATGRCTVATRHNVTGVARTPSGEWQVSVDHIDADGTVQVKKILTAKALVMAAGTANTTRLLMRAGAKGDIPDLPDGLGTNWGSNGDRIYTWTNLADDFGAPQGGPVVYGTKDWSDPATANTVIQASLPPLPNLRTTMLVGYGISAGRGKFVYDSAKDDAVLHWPMDADAALSKRIHTRISRIAGSLSGLVDTTAIAANTWHPLGGASMGSVCDLEGRVLGQRGLYVLDGALMPGTTAACNPSMTIAAVAERALDRLVRDDVGRVI
ncbi:GMC oxidoreductase [Cryptosporangium minutisporangium]|uniref:Cholesterol oxidase n=1 Tax=Cryptosporangium minutisporangium TaxID=113569 RepID=A0ABP6SYD6_9ACTN